MSPKDKVKREAVSAGGKLLALFVDWVRQRVKARRERRKARE